MTHSVRPAAAAWRKQRSIAPSRLTRTERQNLRRAILTALAALALASPASADVGIAHGIGPHAPHPLTPHIGRVYWHPGDGSSAAASNDRELSNLIAELEHKQRKLSCAELRAKYFGRHGVTTPRPLKGYSGCKKAAMDNAYWRHRRTQVNLPPANLRAAAFVPIDRVTIAIHNIALPW